MKIGEKNVSKKTKKPYSSIVQYSAGSVVALLGIASLINNIMLFNNNVDQYVAQGYPAADVIKELIPSLLLPGIFEAIAVYGGIAFVLFYVGLINQKMSKCIMLLTEVEARNDAAQESVMEENITDGVMEATQQDEAIAEDNDTTDDSK